MLEPDPADAALRDAADALARRVRERLPAAQAHGRAEIAALPAPLARVLLARLDAQVDRAAPPPASDWLDADRALDAARAWRDAARKAGRVPAPAWTSFLSDGCLLALSHVVRPAETLAAVAFEDDGPDERPAVLLLARIAAVATSPILPEIAGRYVERKGIPRMDRAALESLLRRIDRRMAESFTADEWADAVTPLSVLAGSDGVPYALTVALFEAKGQPEMARAFAGRGRQTPDEIRALLASLLPAPPAPEPPAPEPPAPEPLAPEAAPEPLAVVPDVPHDVDVPDYTAEADDAAGPQHAVALPSADLPLDAPGSDDQDDAHDAPDHAPVIGVPDVPHATDVPDLTPFADAPDSTSAPDIVDVPTIDAPAMDDLTTTSPLAPRPVEVIDSAPPTTTDRDLDAWIGPSTPDVRPDRTPADRPDPLGPLPEATAPQEKPSMLAPRPPSPAPVDADTPLWQRYAPAPAAAPDAAPALWKRFMPRPAGPPDAHLPSPPVAPPRPPLPPTPPPGPADVRPPEPRPTAPEDALSGLDRLERAALGHPADDARRALYIADLFGGSEADYGKTLVALARDASWTEASDTIARDVFRRHRVSPLSDAAVAFVDDVESRFRPT